MKGKPFIVFVFSCVFAIWSCDSSKDLQDDDTTSELCINKKEFNFSGYVNDKAKCLNDGVQTIKYI